MTTKPNCGRYKINMKHRGENKMLVTEAHKRNNRANESYKGIHHVQHSIQQIPNTNRR